MRCSQRVHTFRCKGISPGSLLTVVNNTVLCTSYLRRDENFSVFITSTKEKGHGEKRKEGRERLREGGKLTLRETDSHHLFGGHVWRGVKSKPRFTHRGSDGDQGRVATVSENSKRLAAHRRVLLARKPSRFEFVADVDGDLSREKKSTFLSCIE